MAKGKNLRKNAYDEAFLTPMNEQKLGAEPGPDIFNVPVMQPRDVLGVIPGGVGKKIGHSPKAEPKD